MAKRELRPHQGERSAQDNRVKESRLELGLTKVELAKLASLSEKTVDRVERGKHAFRETTHRKVFNALNKVRVRENLSPLTYADLFPIDRAAEENK